MTATDKLRRMLDERGVEWRKPAQEYWVLLGMPEGDSTTIVGELSIEEATDGTLVIWNATPEQAIEATLGAGTCRNVHEPPKDTTFWPSPHFKCSECGATHVSMGYVYYCPNCGRKVVN